MWTALQHPEVAGIVCINPATQPQPAELMEMLRGMVNDGVDHIPGIGADIADPDATESAYDETPLVPLISLVEDGLAPIEHPLRADHLPAAVAHQPAGPRRRAGQR